MRKIKFRVWDKQLGSFFHNVSTLHVEDGIYMQYTGLKDKNGREIYEGDVYHQGDPNITYTVVWNDCSLIGKQNGSSSFAGLKHWKDKIEVIGNIYENPELVTL